MLKPARVVLVLSCLCAAAPRAFSVKSYSLAEYTHELERLAVLAQEARNDRSAANSALEDLEGGWTVADHGQAFTIETSWMEEQFLKLKWNPDKQAYDQLIQHLRAMKADAQGFPQQPPDMSSARATLTQILSRSEFHQVRGPNWRDRLILRIEQWIVRLLSSSLGSSSVPIVGRVVVYTLMAVALGGLAFLFYRTLARSARLESIRAAVQPISAKPWRAWIQEAQAAAGNRLWRDAVHLAYWAGIAFLEENGMWRPDQARTPREYLTLLAQSEQRSALSALTRQLEKTWYGKQPAGPEAFAESLAQLERLGCRPA